MICPRFEVDNDIDLERVNTPAEVKERRWKSCCFILDKEAVQYFIKIFILIGLIIFFSFELHISDTCEDNQLFTGLLTMVIGILIPSPRLK